MVQTVAEVMTGKPASVERGESAAEAARLMARGDMGEVIVLDNGTVAGVVTDRDIAGRVNSLDGLTVPHDRRTD